MKIAIAVWELNISGGTQRQVLQLAIQLQRLGHNVKVYTVFYNDEKCYPELIKEVEVKYLRKVETEIGEVTQSNVTSRFLKRFPPWQELLNEKIYYELLEMIDSDIELLNCHDYKIYPLGAKFKKKYKKPTVFMMNDLPIYVSKPKLNSVKKIIKFLLSPITGKLFYAHRHKQYIASFDRIVVLDNYNKRKLKNDLGLDSVVIRSGLDIGKFKCRIDKRRSEKNIIFTNGIFFPYRRFEDLIEALRLLNEENICFEFHHVGTDRRDPHYASKVYKLVNHYNLNNKVKFHGFVSDRELVNLYQTSDVFVFPNYPQTWGLAVFEAMACGTPVVVSKGCGAAEVLTDGKNGLLVQPKSPQDIAKKLKKLIRDEKLWAKLSGNGRKFVEENIRWDLYGEKMLQLFKEVTGGI